MRLSRTIRRAAVAALAGSALWASGASALSPADGPGGPILVVANPSDPFGRYYAEILRAEGLNEFAVKTVGELSAGALGGYSVVLLAQTGLSSAQASLLSTWVQAGGNLIAMRPDARLAGLLGLGRDGGDLADAYLEIDTRSQPGAGITGATMQYHGAADRWTLAGARPVATLYSSATAQTASPAVTLRTVGAGHAAAFAYDLARSVVSTRQGNPAWAGMRRDGQSGPIRSDNLFFPDWLDFSKARIPQADEQQRLLANLITEMSLNRTPLPRFWYLPRGLEAAVVMTGDDHAAGGTAGRFDQYLADSPRGCSVADWTCVRATSYAYPSTDIPNAATYQAEGFEIALHLSTGCTDYTPASLEDDWVTQLAQFKDAFPGLAAPRTNRTHCIAWSDWASEPKTELRHGVRFDTNYYYWPGSWVQDRPGMFTGSGMPMRFADADGSLIDVYQAPTQITDESAVDIPAHIKALIDGALGPDAYYGVFTMNMHTDNAEHSGSDAIVAEAQARGVPIVSSLQMLTWLDGRNGSSFRGVSYAGQRLRFAVAPAAGARGLEAMIPAGNSAGPLMSLTRNGAPVGAVRRTVKGIAYAVFSAAAGSYVATYGTPRASAPPSAAPSAGVTSRPANRKAPRVALSPRRVRVSRTGRLTLRVKCPRGEVRCRVNLRVTRKHRTVASRRLTVRGGKTAKARLRLRRSFRKRLAHAHSLRVMAVAKARDAAGNRATVRKRIRLFAPARR